MNVKQDHVAKLIAHLNRKQWWHVTPVDPAAYKKRGKFFTSSFREAEFYGRPNDIPEHVTISKPFICDNHTIEKNLLGKIESYEGIGIEEIARIDARLRKEALKRGFDSIVLFSEKGLRSFRQTGKIPRSIELNILKPTTASAFPKPATSR
jgi:hypothetical protein